MFPCTNTNTCLSPLNIYGKSLEVSLMLINAFLLSKPLLFQYIAKWHGWPYECPWYKKYVRHAHGHCSWHRHPMFFAWHRFITVQLEMGKLLLP